MEPVPSKLTKTYPSKGPLQQFRFAEATAFRCFRCSETKKAKLISIYGGDWSRRLCNGCYGRLLALFEIKAGVLPDDQKADLLASALLSIVAVDDQRSAERLLLASEQRVSRLPPDTIRFLATAEYVAAALASDPQLEWSPPVIGLCKATESEIVYRLLRPLATILFSVDLSDDKADKDIGRIASFCTDQTRKPPELGVFAHFLQTTIHSQQRRESSVLIRSFLKLMKEWTGSSWLLDPNGLHGALTSLTTNFRNRAAHIDELSKTDYDACRELVIGENGLLWKLLIATDCEMQTRSWQLPKP
jgi:hypothetical protein